MPNRPGIAGARWRRVGRRVALPLVSLGGIALAAVALERIGDTRRWFATVAGTVFAQTLLNIVALALLAVGALAGAGLFGGHTSAIAFALALPVAGAALVVGAPELLERLQSSRIRFMRN